MKSGRSAICRLLLLLPFFLLTWFFTGPFEWVQNLEGPGTVLPPRGWSTLNIRELPAGWGRFDLKLRIKPGQEVRQLKAVVRPDGRAQSPIRADKERVLFRLDTHGRSATEVLLWNPLDRILTIQHYSLTNYSALNTGFPRLAVLLNPFPRPAYSLPWTLLLILAAGVLTIPGMIVSPRLDFNQRSCRFLAAQFLLPWLALAAAAVLRLSGRHLLLSWESLGLIFLPGALWAILSSRFFRQRGSLPATLFLIILTFALMFGTALGVGIPEAFFGPELIYQSRLRGTAGCTGLAYAFLAFLLYRQKKEWFNPGKSLFLSSIWIVFLPSTIVYLANGYAVFGGDATFNSLLPFRIVQGEGLFFSQEFAAEYGRWGLIQTGDRYLPVFPIGPAFFGLPTAWIQHLFGSIPLHKAVSWNQKVTAVWVAGLSAAFLFQVLYLLSRRLTTSLLLTAGFALGTTQVTISAATLWQHGPAVLLICLGLYFMAKGLEQDPRYLPLAALPMAFLPLVRTQAVLFYLAALGVVLILRPGMVFRFLWWSLPGIFLTLWVNLGLYGHLLGGYAYQAAGSHFSTPWFQGLLGSLFSPNRGLLVFSPFLILGFAGAGSLLVRRSAPTLCFGLAGMLYLLVHSRYYNWHGGFCVGPRFGSELVPLLLFFSAFWFTETRRKAVRWAGRLLVLISIAINLPSSFFLHEQLQWNVFPSIDAHKQERIWDYRDWLPLHFTYRLALEHFREVPAYAFADAKPLQPVKSKAFHYRVLLPLNDEPLEFLKMENIYLRRGSYRIWFKGASPEAEKALLELNLDFIGRGQEKAALPVSRQSSFLISQALVMEKSGWVNIRLKGYGKGVLLLDTVRIGPGAGGQ